MNERILIIEDNQANLELVEYLLSSFGFRTLAAHDGLEGLEAVRREHPDLVVCDIELPVMDGRSVAREIKSDPAVRSIPLIAVTAFAMVGDRDGFLASGFDGYITKPIDPRAFVREIEGVLRTKPTLDAEDATERGEGPPAFSHTGVRILVVDDLPINLSLQRSILEPFGYAVITASGMAQGLDMARRHRPSLIISDVNMSDGSGFEFVQVVKNDPVLSGVPFVLMTSTMWSEAARARGLALGADRFLFRPIEPQAMLAEVESCLRGVGD